MIAKPKISSERYLGPLRDIPFNGHQQDPGFGRLFWEDFTNFPGHPDASSAITPVIGRFNAYIYGGSLVGQAGSAAYLHGAIGLGSDGDDEGAALQAGTPCFQIVNDGTVGKLIYGVRFKTSTITDSKHGLFVGLCEQLNAGASATNIMVAAKPIKTDDTLSDNNFIGFHRLAGDGDQIDFVYKADGQTQQTKIADGLTLVADTWYVCAFVFDPATRDINVFLNSNTPNATTVTAANIAAATFPSDVLLTPTLAVMNTTATTPGTSSIDYVICSQVNP